MNYRWIILVSQLILLIINYQLSSVAGERCDCSYEYAKAPTDGPTPGARR